MDVMLEIVFYTALAGACIPLGGLLARIERVRPQWLEQELRHSIIAFGGIMSCLRRGRLHWVIFECKEVLCSRLRLHRSLGFTRAVDFGMMKRLA